MAKKFKLAGTNDLEQVQVDMYVDQTNDLLNEMIRALTEKDETKKAELNAKLQNELAADNFKIFVAKLNQTNSGYLVGKSLTFADLFVMHITELLSRDEKIKQSLDNFQELKKHYEKIRAIPNIEKWLKSRPVTSV